MTTSRIRTRERDTIIQALRAGVVPKVGLQHIQVGRARETEELVRDIERTGEGGSAIRFVIGEYGSGKTFFLNLVRLVAMEKGLVVRHHHPGATCWRGPQGWLAAHTSRSRQGNRGTGA